MAVPNYSDGFTLPVTAIEVVYEPTTVYNFSVNGNHNYYVSEDGVLVHNTSCSLAARQAIMKANAKAGDAGEDAVRDMINRSKNVELVGEQIRIRTPGEGSYRVTDFIVRSKKNPKKMWIYEVKTGKAKRSKGQRDRDVEIENPNPSKPTRFFGRKARAAEGIDTGLDSPALRTYVIRPEKLMK